MDVRYHATELSVVSRPTFLRWCESVSGTCPVLVKSKVEERQLFVRRFCHGDSAAKLWIRLFIGSQPGHWYCLQRTDYLCHSRFSGRGRTETGRLDCESRHLLYQQEIWKPTTARYGTPGSYFRKISISSAHRATGRRWRRRNLPGCSGRWSGKDWCSRTIGRQSGSL